jgi:hypothetical protein
MDCLEWIEKKIIFFPVFRIHKMNRSFHKIFPYKNKKTDFKIPRGAKK